MALHYDRISSIVSNREAIRLMVRVVRLWTVPMFNNPTHTSSLEMLLVDEHGGKIQATVRKPLLYKFGVLLEEGCSYKMAYFNVVANGGGYRASPYDFRLVFLFKTTVQRREFSYISRFGLTCIPFNEILNFGDNYEYLIDVIGLLTCVYPERQYTKDGNMTSMAVMELTDSSGTIECALFGEYVDQLRTFLNGGENVQVVVVLQLARVKSFKGMLYSFDFDNDGDFDIYPPEDLLILGSNGPIESIVSCIYPNLLANMNDFKFYEERAILVPRLEMVEQVNNYVLSLIPGDEKEYLSSDSVSRMEEINGINTEWLTSEFLNQISCSGLPNHKLVFKVGVPVMLLRNIDQSSGLCNGTRLVVTELGMNVIGAKLATGTHIGEKVYIPRLNLEPSDHVMPFRFQRRQFPLVLSFAMTINKSQGQTLSHVGLYFLFLHMVNFILLFLG